MAGSIERLVLSLNGWLLEQHLSCSQANVLLQTAALSHGNMLDCRSALAREDVLANTSDYLITPCLLNLALAFS